MTAYTFSSDAIQTTIEAETLDAAAAEFAESEGLDGETMDEVLESVSGLGGYLTVLHEDGYVVAKTAE